MSMRSDIERSWLGGSLMFFLAANLLHFAHNAEFLAEYPNLPARLTRADVYLVWLASAVVGVGGFLLYRAGRAAIGLLLTGAYAATGFDGLLHYTRAPVAAHTGAMNATIWLEAVAGGCLLLVVTTAAVSCFRLGRHVRNEESSS
jgi:hypothetical protein